MSHLTPERGDSNERPATSRWIAICDRVRHLARTRMWFADALADAVQGFAELHRRNVAQRDELISRERDMARELLERGLLVDPKTHNNSPCTFYSIHWPCAKKLAERLQGYSIQNPPKDELLAEAAAAALEALEQVEEYNRRDIPDEKKKQIAETNRARQEAGTHVLFDWELCLSLPRGWKDPANPWSFAPGELARFDIDDRLTIALYRLGGMADYELAWPIVRKPSELDSEDESFDMAIWLAWDSRIQPPPESEASSGLVTAIMGTGSFTTKVAEEFLAIVEAWVISEDSRHGTAETPSATGGLSLPMLEALIERAVARALLSVRDQEREQEQRDEQRLANPSGLFVHAEDFTWIVWSGTRYDFSKGQQAECIRALWISWERSGKQDGCGLSEKSIGVKCGSAATDFRLAHVFRNHLAWGTVIRASRPAVFALYR